MSRRLYLCLNLTLKSVVWAELVSFFHLFSSFDVIFSQNSIRTCLFLIRRASQARSFPIFIYTKFSPAQHQSAEGGRRQSSRGFAHLDYVMSLLLFFSHKNEQFFSFLSVNGLKLITAVNSVFIHTAPSLSPEIESEEKLG